MSCMSAILSGGELLEQTTTQADWGIKKDSDEIQMHEAIPEPGSSLGSHFVFCAGPQVFISALLIFSSFHETVLNVYYKAQLDHQPWVGLIHNPRAHHHRSRVSEAWEHLAGST